MIFSSSQADGGNDDVDQLDTDEWGDDATEPVDVEVAAQQF